MKKIFSVTIILLLLNLFSNGFYVQTKDDNLSDSSLGVLEKKEYNNIREITQQNPTKIEILEEKYHINDERTELPSPVKLYSGLYATFTSVSSTSSILQKGEETTVSSLTEWESYARVPVPQGYVNWYDLEQKYADNEAVTDTIGLSTVAIEFQVDSTFNYAAFSLNLSAVTEIIDTTVIQMYITENVENYSSDYLMHTEISDASYQFHVSNPDSPLLFGFWNHPFTNQEGNQFETGLSYYLILSASGTFHLQYSDDTQGHDDNRVFVYNSGLWSEIPAIDIQCAIYAGQHLSTSSTDSGGDTVLNYNSALSLPGEHIIVASYYDLDMAFEMSADFVTIQVVDDLTPQHLYIYSPEIAEYGDNIAINTSIENQYNAPINGEMISIYYSLDNQTWVLLDESISDENGSTQVIYTIQHASNNVYFKAISEDLTAFSFTQQEKKELEIIVPNIVLIYGSEEGFSDISSFEINARILDTTGNPLVGVEIIISRLGLQTPLICTTNSSGWITTSPQIVNWEVNLYSDAFSVRPNLSEEFYIFTEIFGTVEILPNSIQIDEPSDISCYTNESFSITFSLYDAENDSIAYLEYELQLINLINETEYSLGLFTTDQEGKGSQTFDCSDITKGNYLVDILVNSSNYELFEHTINLEVLEDVSDPDPPEPEKIETILITLQTSYYYNTLESFEVTLMTVTGESLPNMTLTITFANEVYTLQTDANGTVAIILSALNAAEYTCNIIFEGSQHYKSSSKDVNLVILPKPTNISYDIEDSIITILLEDNGNNPLPNKELEFSYLDNGEIIFLAFYVTNNQGSVIVNVTEVDIPSTSYIVVKFHGEQNYEESQQSIFVNINDYPKIIPQDDKESNNLFLETSVSVLSLFGLISFRHLTRKKNSKQ